MTFSKEESQQNLPGIHPFLNLPLPAGILQAEEIFQSREGIQLNLPKGYNLFKTQERRDHPKPSTKTIYRLITKKGGNFGHGKPGPYFSKFEWAYDHSWHQHPKIYSILKALQSGSLDSEEIDKWRDEVVPSSKKEDNRPTIIKRLNQKKEFEIVTPSTPEKTARLAKYYLSKMTTESRIPETICEGLKHASDQDLMKLMIYVEELLNTRSRSL